MRLDHQENDIPTTTDWQLQGVLGALDDPDPQVKRQVLQRLVHDGRINSHYINGLGIRTPYAIFTSEGVPQLENRLIEIINQSSELTAPALIALGTLNSAEKYVPKILSKAHPNLAILKGNLKPPIILDDEQTISNDEERGIYLAALRALIAAGPASKPYAEQITGIMYQEVPLLPSVTPQVRHKVETEWKEYQADAAQTLLALNVDVSHDAPHIFNLWMSTQPKLDPYGFPLRPDLIDLCALARSQPRLIEPKLTEIIDNRHQYAGEKLYTLAGAVNALACTGIKDAHHRELIASVYTDPIYHLIPPINSKDNTEQDTEAVRVSKSMSAVKSSTAGALIKMEAAGLQGMPPLNEVLLDVDAESLPDSSAIKDMSTPYQKNLAAQAQALLKSDDTHLRLVTIHLIANLQLAMEPTSHDLDDLLQAVATQENAESLRVLLMLASEQSIKETFKLGVEKLFVERLQSDDEKRRNTALQALQDIRREDPSPRIRGVVTYLPVIIDNPIAGRLVVELNKLLKDVRTDENAKGMIINALGNMRNAGAPYIKELTAPIIPYSEATIRDKVSETIPRMGPLNMEGVCYLLEMLLKNGSSTYVRSATYFVAGNNKTAHLLLRTVGRSTSPGDKQINPKEVRERIGTIDRVLKYCGDLPTLQNELGRQTFALMHLLGNGTKDKNLLNSVAEQIPKTPYAEAIHKRTGETTGWWGGIVLWIVRLISIYLGVVLLLILFLLFYSKSRKVRAFFFWSPLGVYLFGSWLFHVLSLVFPSLRNKMFYSDVREAFVEDAHPHNLTDQVYYGKLTVKSERPGLLLTECIPHIHGRILLTGPSGAGKSYFTRRIVSQSLGRIVVFLPAHACTRGVVEAISAKFPEGAINRQALLAHIYTGTIDICIDGLNEVNPDARARITQFMSAYRFSNVLITTQPIDWNPPENIQHYELESLNREQMLEFLELLWSSAENPAVSQGQYHEACILFVNKNRPVPQSEPSTKEDLTAQDTQPLSSLLLTPMDLTVVANMLAGGEEPDLLRLQQQQYDLMEAEYRLIHNHNEFPLMRIGELAYDMRLNEQTFLPQDMDPTLRAAANCMSNHKMLVPRGGDWLFRHDKIMDFFIMKTFLGQGNERVIEHLADLRFRGVYLQMALLLPADEAARLRNVILRDAYNRGDHSVSEAFLRHVWLRSDM